MLDYSALRVLLAVVQSGSFEKAASSLNVTPSAVSQRIKQLEERFGTALVVRGNPCIATEKGDQLCTHMENVGILEHELFTSFPALADNDDLHQRYTLRVATNADSLGTWFLEAVSEFSKSSSFLFEISVDDQDYTAEWLAQGKVIAAVSGSHKPIAGCRRYSLGVLRYHATASPAFVATYFPDGVTPEALAHAPTLTFNQKDQLQSEWVRRTLQADVRLPTHWLPSTQSFVDATIMGMAWGMNPHHLVQNHLSAGRLVELIPGITLDIPLYWHINRFASDRLATLTAKIVEVAEQTLHQAE
jgi:LysR family transcriptional regulator (chromosome initiation inhibitor)